MPLHQTLASLASLLLAAIDSLCSCGFALRAAGGVNRIVLAFYAFKREALQRQGMRAKPEQVAKNPRCPARAPIVRRIEGDENGCPRLRSVYPSNGVTL
jgi:hypothetical protein